MIETPVGESLGKSTNFEELHPGSHLTGYVGGHANHRHTVLVYTSPILNFDFSQGVVETITARYRLGEASDEYKAWYYKGRATAA
jgi:hypothetical protein